MDDQCNKFVSIVKPEGGGYKTLPGFYAGVGYEVSASIPICVCARQVPRFYTGKHLPVTPSFGSRLPTFVAFGRCGRGITTSAHRPRLATEGLLKRARGVVSGSAKGSGAWMVPRVKWTAGSAPTERIPGRTLTVSRQARPCGIPTKSAGLEECCQWCGYPPASGHPSDCEYWRQR